jgi:hypothetical protein
VTHLTEIYHGAYQQLRERLEAHGAYINPADRQPAVYRRFMRICQRHDGQVECWTNSTALTHTWLLQVDLLGLRVVATSPTLADLESWLELDDALPQ